jgi:hypothetical protein
MNNPFGMPDDLFDAIIATSAKTIAQQAAEAQKRSVPPKRPEPMTQNQSIEKGAEAAKKIYDSYLKVGFTEPQAFDLLKCVLTKNNK